MNPAEVAETRQEYFINIVRDMLGDLKAGTNLELSLGRQSNRVVLTGRIDQVSLPELAKGADKIFLDYFDGNIVACHFVEDREISRLYLVEEVKSLVWEAYFEKAEQWLPIYVESSQSERPSKIRLVYQLENGSEKTEIFPVSSAESVKIAAID